MKRSVILMGGKTYVVSLPSQWVKRYDIKKGEELDLEIIDNTLLIRTKNSQKKKSLTCDISKIEVMVNRCIGAIYKAGYDEAKILFSNKDQLKIIEKVLSRTCIGFEIFEQKENYIILRNLADVDIQSFESSLKRLFYTLEITAEMYSKASKKEDFEEIIKKDDQTNKIADFCRRVLNKGETKHIHMPTVTYYIIEQLERIGDIYKKLSQFHFKDSNKEIAKEVHSLLTLYRHIYYDFSLEKIENFGTSFKALQKCIKELEPNKETIFLEMIAEHIYDMNGALLTSRI